MLGHPHRISSQTHPVYSWTLTPGELAGEYGYLLEQLGQDRRQHHDANQWLAEKYTIGRSQQI